MVSHSLLWRIPMCKTNVTDRRWKLKLSYIYSNVFWVAHLNCSSSNSTIVWTGPVPCWEAFSKRSNFVKLRQCNEYDHLCRETSLQRICLSHVFQWLLNCPGRYHIHNDSSGSKLEELYFLLSKPSWVLWIWAITGGSFWLRWYSFVLL